MKKFLTNSKGFTLVELMVVVAIIGILSAIAVPNFKKYQAKSKQSEAKIQLAAVYATEVAANADYDTYATCIVDLGYEQPPKGYYIVGFAADEANSRNQVNTRSGNTICTNTNFAVPPVAGKHMKVDAAALPAATNLPATAVSATSFDAAAVGDIAGGNTVPYDIWKIDETKALTNTVVGF